MAARNATRKTSDQGDTSPSLLADTSPGSDTGATSGGDNDATSRVASGDTGGDTSQVGEGDTSPEPQGLVDAGDDPPEGYKQGYGAFAGGGLVATAATVSQLMAESSAAGHARPTVIVPVYRPAPGEGAQ